MYPEIMPAVDTGIRQRLINPDSNGHRLTLPASVQFVLLDMNSLSRKIDILEVAMDRALGPGINYLRHHRNPSVVPLLPQNEVLATNKLLRSHSLTHQLPQITSLLNQVLAEEKKIVHSMNGPFMLLEFDDPPDGFSEYPYRYRENDLITELLSELPIYDRDASLKTCVLRRLKLLEVRMDQARKQLDAYTLLMDLAVQTGVIDHSDYWKTPETAHGPRAGRRNRGWKTPKAKQSQVGEPETTVEAEDEDERCEKSTEEEAGDKALV
jgi:hypothetical protein